jgi:catechol 2,3-dioxygenase-like lactoylglutathione lyase family enzyme
MTVRLDHTIVPATDQQASADFLAHILGVEVGAPTPPFVPITVGNGVTLDYLEKKGAVSQHHYAFTVSDAEFDAALARLQAADVTIYAGPDRRPVGEINHRFGGRGCYFDDPDGHLMEIMTRPEAPS